MQTTKKRNIKNGYEFDYLFPPAKRDTHTILKGAEVSDTVAFIPKVVHKTLAHTEKIAKILIGKNPYDTCRNIWEFVYRHIAYEKDRDGYEQIRSPARTWHDRKNGVDCDCYTTFISSVLTNLNIRHKLRITKYSHNYFQHIYPVALLDNGREVPIDCVTEQFDYEVPFTEKKDFKMDLQFLDGIEGIGIDGGVGSETGTTIGSGVQGAENLDFVRYTYGDEGLGKKHSHEDFEDFMSHGDSVPGYGIRKKKGFKKILNFVNKLNPATTLLRNGVLASSKLNIGRMGSKLRWAYLTPNEARKKGMDMERWKKLVQVRQKLDNIYYGAGGKPENLKKAILKGKGNKDKSVHGLEDVGELGNAVDGDNSHDYTIQTPLQHLLGTDIFHSENEGNPIAIHGLGDLGEPVTMAAVASASGVIAVIVKMLKKVGDVFKGGKGSSDFADHPDDNPDNFSEDGSKKDGDGDSSELSMTKSGGKNSKQGDSGDDPSDGNSNGSHGVKGFIEKHKKMIVPAAIGIGGIAAIAIGVHAFSGKHKSSPQPDHPNHPVSGTPKSRNPFSKEHHRKPKHHGKGHGKGKHKKGKIKKVAL